MDSPGDLRIAEKVADASAALIREYIREMRSQGRIQGKLWVVVRDGKKEFRFPSDL